MKPEHRVRSGLHFGVTIGPIELLQSRQMRVLGQSEGLPILPDTHALLCKHPHTQNGVAQRVFAQLAEQQGSLQYRASDERTLDFSLAR